MTDDQQKEIFTKNLNQLIEKSGKTQKEIADALNLNPQTVNSWCKGNALPRMGKIQMLSDYFNVSKYDLIEEKSETNADWSTPPELTDKDRKDIAKDLEEYRKHLSSAEGLMFDGEPATEEAIQSIIDSLEVGIEIAKKRNKEKYTPKKYRK